jgi:adenosylhomocysteine nucleosidase
MRERRILILTALEMEALAIAPALASLRGACDLRVIGPKGPRLPVDLHAEECRAIVTAGLAGGLEPSLAVGAVVVDAEPPSAACVAAGPWRVGVIHTAAHLAATPTAKAALFARTRADVVDLENAHARALAVRLGIPFLGLRAVSDTAHDSLDPALLDLVDEAGRVRRRAVAALLLRRPRILHSLLRLRASSAIARRGLACAVGELLVERRWPDGR